MDRQYLITGTKFERLKDKWVGQVVEMTGNAYYGFEFIHPDGSKEDSIFFYFKKADDPVHRV